MISRQWWPACEVLTLWRWQCNESLSSCARGRWLLLLPWVEVTVIIPATLNHPKNKETEGFGCCVTAICSSFQFPTTHASVTLAWLQSGIMSSVGLWWVCVLIHKQINQNKVRFTATLNQSKHPRSLQQKFTSRPVDSHEMTFFTKMNHKLQRATTVLAMWANILPCGSVFFLKGAVCLDACGPKALVYRESSFSQTSSMCVINFHAGFISLPPLLQKLYPCVDTSLYVWHFYVNQMAGFQN